MMTERLNIGCGPHPLEGYVNVDKVAFPGVDVVMDLDNPPYPFESATFDQVRAMAVLEHVHDVAPVMEELARIMKPGATISIKVPHYMDYVTYRDPTHYRGFSYFTFDFFTSKHGPHVPTLFSVVEKRMELQPLPLPFGRQRLNPLYWFANRFPGAYERHLAFIFPARNIYTVLQRLRD